MASVTLRLCTRASSCPSADHFCRNLQFCPGELSEREALLAAVKTWPQGIRPVVHWSESQASRIRGISMLQAWWQPVQHGGGGVDAFRSAAQCLLPRGCGQACARGWSSLWPK